MTERIIGQRSAAEATRGSSGEPLALTWIPTGSSRDREGNEFCIS